MPTAWNNNVALLSVTNIMLLIVQAFWKEISHNFASFFAVRFKQRKRTWKRKIFRRLLPLNMNSSLNCLRIHLKAMLLLLPLNCFSQKVHFQIGMSIKNFEKVQVKIKGSSHLTFTFASAFQEHVKFLSISHIYANVRCEHYHLLP